MAKWYSTEFKGIRYRKHPTRKNGAVLDKYFTIRFQANGERIEEGLGWESEGWKLSKVVKTLEELKENSKKGEGPIRLQKKREITRKKESDEELQKLTFDNAFQIYIEWAEGNKKTWKDDRYNYNYFLKSYIGKKFLPDVDSFFLEQVKTKLTKKRYAPATVKHCLVLVRQVFNKMIAWDKYNGENPTQKIKMPTVVNRKERAFTPEEENELMPRLHIKSTSTWAMAMTSLYAGLRFSEVAQLRWQQINFSQQQITVHGKGEKVRTVPMNRTVSKIYKDLKAPSAQPYDLVFPTKRGEIKKQASDAYFRTVAELKLNEGVTDNRYRLNYHTLRHSYATRLATAGTPLHVIRDLLGHADLKMVSRYAHLIPGQADDMVAALDVYQQEEPTQQEVMNTVLKKLDGVVEYIQENIKTPCDVGEGTFTRLNDSIKTINSIIKMWKRGALKQ